MSIHREVKNPIKKKPKTIKAVSMKKHFASFLLLVTVLFANQVPVGVALHRTYEWDHLLYGEPNHYQAYIAASDVWQVGTDVNVTFKLTLTSKGSSLNYTEIVSVGIRLHGSYFDIDSGDISGTEVLRTEGDSWERNASFYIPTEYVGRSKADNVSISFKLTYNEIDNIAEYSLQTVYGPTTYDAMYVNLFRPLLSDPELIAVAVVGLVTLGGISGSILYRRRVSAKSPSPSE